MTTNFNFDLGQYVYAVNDKGRIFKGTINSVHYQKMWGWDKDLGTVSREYKTYLIGVQSKDRFLEEQVFETLEAAAQSLLTNSIVSHE